MSEWSQVLPQGFHRNAKRWWADVIGKGFGGFDSGGGGGSWPWGGGEKWACSYHRAQERDGVSCFSEISIRKSQFHDLKEKLLELPGLALYLQG